MKDHYEVLGVSKTATNQEIKDAFRRLARKHHPDVNPDNPEAEETFKEMNNAYSVLSDPEKRRAYDMGAGDSSQVNSGYDPFMNFFGGFENSPFHSYFDPMGRPQPGGPRQVSPNTDIEATFIVDPVDSFKSQEAQIQYQRIRFCHDCNGEGGKDGRIACPDCQGQKFKAHRYNHNTVVHSPCERCQQRGFIFKQVCDTCKGFGVNQETATYTVNVPVGSYFKKLRVSGGGNQADSKFSPGDLIIVVLPPTPYKSFQFTNDGTVYSELLLDPIEALVGVEKKVKDIKGENVTLQVPAGSHEKQILRIAEHGLMTSETTRGVFAVVVKYDYSSTLSEEQKKILLEYLNTKKEKEVTK